MLLAFDDTLVISKDAVVAPPAIEKEPFSAGIMIEEALAPPISCHAPTV
jgi:hypothetical protein